MRGFLCAQVVFLWIIAFDKYMLMEQTREADLEIILIEVR